MTFNNNVIKKIKNKINYTVIMPRHKKCWLNMPCQRLIMESGESDGLGGSFEESHFYKDRIQFIFFTGDKTKNALYYRGFKHY